MIVGGKQCHGKQCLKLLPLPADYLFRAETALRGEGWGEGLGAA